MKILSLGVASLFVAAGLTACSSTPAPAEGLQVVATTTHVTEFTSTLVGETGEVTGLIGPNQSAHSFDPSAQQLVALGEADAVVVNGAGLEPWLDAALDASGFSGQIIDASTGITLLQSGETSKDHAAHAGDEEHAEGEEGHDDHAHAEGDPHIWTSPANAIVMVNNIEEGLLALPELDAATAEEIRIHADEYETQLLALDEWATASIDQVPAEQRLLVTNHDAFTYFVDAYGLTFVGSIIPGFDDNAEPSAAELDQLIADIKSSGTPAIFSESSISPKLAETIAAEAGVKVYSGDEGLYSDSLGVAGSSGETYIKATIHNVTVLMESWGYTPLPLPSELSS
jgi:zinc/manganese transport system substrate-binding protein/manganese/iron transport system substrate-binding protein